MRLATLVLGLAALAEAAITYRRVKEFPAGATDRPRVEYTTPRPGTCVTANGSQKQYTGHVYLPPGTVSTANNNTSIRTFFWFAEGRNPNGPLTVWLNGGPGASSLIGMFQELGPCEVVQLADKTYGTQARNWSWDRSSNLLFIDQPAHTGLSFDDLKDALFNAQTGSWEFTPRPASERVPEYAWIDGVASSQNATSITPTSVQSAYAVWHTIQEFLKTFPEYQRKILPLPGAKIPVSIHLAGESYAGIYLPRLAGLIRSVTADYVAGRYSGTQVALKIESLTLVNAMIDFEEQVPAAYTYMYRNTYGFNLLDEAGYNAGIALYNSPGGCAEQIAACQTISASLDPGQTGTNSAVKAVCFPAVMNCIALQAPYIATNRNFYDVRVMNPFAFPYNGYLEYVNNQLAGDPGFTLYDNNYTPTNSIVHATFMSSGDPLLSSQIDLIADLVRDGISVHMMFGDADFICNWFGGEQVAKRVANKVSATFGARFESATYNQIWHNQAANIAAPGVVKQAGTFSFARIYDAGHFAPTYQPETTYRLFDRVLNNRAIDNGAFILPALYKTRFGATAANYVNTATTYFNQGLCWIRDIYNCPQSSRDMIAAGGGVLVGGVVYSSSADAVAHIGHQPTGVVGKPGTPSAYVPGATATP